MSSPALSNLGPEVRAVITMTASITLDGGSKFFDLDGFLVDWSAFTAGQGYSFLVRPTDNISVSLNNQQPNLLIVVTDAPVQLNYTESGTPRTVVINPLVQPANYFTTSHSPSEQPIELQRGIFILTCGPVTAMTLVGVAGTTVSANVRIGIAGYQQ